MRNREKLWTVRTCAGLFFALSLLAGAQPRVPELRVDTAESSPEFATRLGAIDQTQLHSIMRLTGLDDPGGPIRVVLAGEYSEAARATPPWIAGLADGSSDTIVLFPSRSPRYPHDSLEAVLHHEVAHILIHRSARRRPVPRWFNEGLATIGERAWTFEDRRQLAWALAAGRRQPMHAVERAFQGDHAEAAQAYALSSAFVRDVIARHGTDAIP